jgi:outer membrane protein assembly factor BamB
MLIAAGVMLANPAEDLADSAPAPAVVGDELVAAQTTERYALPDIVATTGVPFVGADPKRLPDRLDSIWSRTVPADATDDVWVEVIDRRFAVVVVGDDRASPTASSVLRSLDAESGVTRWSIDLEVPPRAVSFVAATADTVALIVAGQLIGIDSATGEEVWRLVRAQPIFASGVNRLRGTGFLAIRASGGTSTLVDITSGETVGQLEGPTIGTDHLGRWFVRRGADIVAYDLGDGFQEPVLVAVGVEDPVVAVLGREVLASSSEGWNVSAVSAEEIGFERDVPEGADEFPTAVAILPMLGTTFVVAGPGSIVGANLDGRTMRLGWMRNGAVTAMYPTERGFLIHAATEGGAIQTIYDGRTGDDLATLTITPGQLESLEVTANGLLTKEASSDGTRLAGLDLDGTEIWSIRDVQEASVGDRLIVTTKRLDDGSVRLDAVGDIPTS